MCRASIDTFTDANGRHAPRRCHNRWLGCNGLHERPICPYELFNHLNREQRVYLTFILMGILHFDTPEFHWTEYGYNVLTSLRQLWNDRPELWEGFIPSDELLEVLRHIIYQPSHD